METTTKTARRGSPREKGDRRVIRLELKDGMGRPRTVTADLIDVSDSGACISVLNPLNLDEKVTVRGKLADGEEENSEGRAAVVRWCMDSEGGSYRAGLEFEELRKRSPKGDQQSDASQESPRAVDPQEIDCYEFMELSPNATRETIDRVYRMLAQRFHPDNAETGDSERFMRLTEVYRTLNDPERRAAYDARHAEIRRNRWKIFDQGSSVTGRDAEKRKRQGILELLYSRMVHEPARPSMGLMEIEDLLGCPREHLEAALWFLRGKDYIKRSDSARYEITVEGFEAAENAHSDGSMTSAQERKLLAS